MIDQKTAPFAALVLRITMGIMFLAHAYLKGFVFGLVGSGKYFVSLGLPDWFIYPVIVLEAVGGLALVFGVYARWFSLALFAELLGTIVVAHGANGWVAGAKGGGWEFPALWAAALLALALFGDGALALARSPALPGGK